LEDLSALAGLASLEQLYLSENNVTDLSPLAGLAALEYLEIGQNSVSDVTPLAGLTGLRSLLLYNNRILDASPLAALTLLELLNLNGNHLTTLAPLVAGTVFSECTGAPTLYVQGNPLLAEVCDTQIPALEARGVTVYHNTPCTGPVYVPDVTGDALSVAGDEIADAGLGLGTVTQSFSETVPAGFVISQYPAAGVPAVPSSGVDLVVSKGPEVAVLVIVPDVNLAAAIRSQLSLDPGTPLTTAHLAALTFLSAGWSGVADLTGLECGVNLTTLYLGGSAITDLSPLAGLTGLHSIALDTNALTDISPLAGLVRLETLYLQDNHIADAGPLAGLTALTDIDLYDNLVEDATPFAGLVHLTQLGLRLNRLTDVSPLAGLDVLRNLVISENFITTLEPLVSGTVFTNATDQECYVQDNPLAPEVCATQIPALEARGVDVYHDDCDGGVAVPDVVGMTLATAEWTLSQGDLSVGAVTHAFSGTVPAGHVISQDVPPGTIAVEGYAVALTVSDGPEGGQLVNVPDPVLAAAIRVEAGLDPGTPLTTAHLASIFSLYVSYTGVTDLTGLEYAVNLGALQASGNAIPSAAPLSGLASLWEVYLYNNLLTDAAPLANLSRLVTLDIGRNHITSVAPLAAGTVFTGASTAPSLYLEGNPLLTGACDTDIPALEARGVTVYHDDPCPGSVLAPDVVGRTYISAQHIIDAEGLVMGSARAFSETVAAGYVISQIPAAGTPIVPGSAVDAIVSRGPEAGQLVSVPDAVLAAAIRNALGLDPAAPLTTEHLADLGYLSTGGVGVTDLTGLEYAVNLTSLYLDGESPADLSPISGLTDLGAFSCYQCGITDVTPLAGLVSLHSLYLSGNGVTDPTPLSAVTGLEILDLSYNGLTSADWAAAHSGLLHLYLSDNQLTDVTPLAGLTLLRSLTLSNNLLTDATPLASLSELEMLGLAYNYVETLAPLVAGTIFTAAAAPGDVYFGGNPFGTDVCDTQIPALETRGVTIYHDICLGTTYVPDVVGLTEAGARAQFTGVGLNWNTPTEVFSDIVPAGYVISQHPPAGFPVVPSSHMDITVSLGPEAGQLVNVPDAILADEIRSELALAPATPLTTAHLAELYSLNVSATGVADLTGMEYAVNLVFLYAGVNSISSAAPLGGLVNLISVFLNNNLLTDASPFTGMSVIRDLSFDNNSLTDTAPLADLSTLNGLGLNNNQLTTLAPLVSGTVFTNAINPPILWVQGNPFLSEVCTTQIPALEAAGVSVQHSCP
jgi:Leucine-rich repeat (LRR) protein